MVVLTFFDAPCNDIVPVLAAEIEQADADLGADAADVEFVTVNTDPNALAQSAEAPLLRATRLGTLPNWHMVTGSSSLDSALEGIRSVDFSSEEDRTGSAQRRDLYRRCGGGPA